MLPDAVSHQTWRVKPQSFPSPALSLIMNDLLLKEYILTDGKWTNEGSQYTVNKESSHRASFFFFLTRHAYNFAPESSASKNGVYEGLRNDDCCTESK